MFKIYDTYNNYEYAQGSNLEELIQDWNNKAQDNLSWLIDGASPDFQAYQDLTDEVYRPKELCRTIANINAIEVNDLQVFKDGQEVDLDDLCYMEF